MTLQVIEGYGYGSGSASSGIPQSASVSEVYVFEMSSNLLPQNLPIIPALLQTATLALLMTSIPLATALTSTLIAVDSNGTLLSDPLPKQLKDLPSVHIFAFSTKGELLVAESEGDFTFDVWQRAHDRAIEVCRGSQANKSGSTDDDGNKDVDMDVESTTGSSKEDILRQAVREQALKDQRWKQDSD